MDRKFPKNGLLRDKVLWLMKSEEEFGGPQSVDDLCKNLRISNGSSRSVLIKLLQSGKIDRINHGIYRIKGDTREFNRTKDHMHLDTVS